MNEDKSMLTIVVPCYNEEEVLPEAVMELGGVQLICISMIGEYIGKIYSEVKARPRFTIEEDGLYR